MAIKKFFRKFGKNRPEDKDSSTGEKEVIEESSVNSGDRKADRAPEMNNIRSRIEKLEKEQKKLSTQDNDRSEIEEKIEKLDEKISRYGKRIQEVEEKLDQSNIQKEKNTDESKYSELSANMDETNQKVEELEERIENISEESFDNITGEEIESKIEKRIQKESFNELNKIQKLESRIDQLEDRINIEELEELNESDEALRKVENTGDRKEEKKSQNGRRTVVPDRVSEDMEGERVKIEGELEFRKESGGNKFYRLSGNNGQVIVRSKNSIPEGRRILNGEVEIVKGNICIFVEE